MARYIAVIDYAGRQFGAHFPDAPGCTAMGSTAEEVMANATDALMEWVADAKSEGRPIRTPRTYVQLLRSRDFPEFGARGFIATIPL